ncbi:S1C family serine protease [Blastococcus sp. Marseille-P5729]|uniref:S1C family serine protease n=1 Tax=Blastococcus sp. Marseille-P5729 TaxID=2086582 RepID=UPI000D0F6F38|nr:trypsin-like peptidase domain-containing protein [Blastococcus sp. Marseille-P5729]
MSNDGPRHSDPSSLPEDAGSTPHAPEEAASTPRAPEDAATYARPDGVDGGFVRPAAGPPQGRPAAPQPSPGEQQAFGRPAGIAGGFVQPPGTQPRFHRPPPPAAYQQAFGRPQGTPGTFGANRPPFEQRYTQASPPIAYQKAFGRPQGAADLQRQPGLPPYTGGELPSKTWWEEAPRDPWRDPEADAALAPAPRLAGDEDPSDDGAVELDKKRRRRIRLGDIPVRVAAALAALALVLGVAGGVGGFFLAKSASQTPLTKPSPEYNEVANNKEPGSIVEIAEKVSPSVVSIEVLVGNSGGTGSGVVVEADGYILTNNHVISMAADAQDATINVYFVDGSISPAQIVGRDPQADLAVLKVDKPGLVPVDIGKSSELKVGEDVIAFGSPLGLAGTVTTGIVSALDRPMHLAGEGADTDAYILAVQTDASINPGNSGGALVDSQGALIGINTAIASFSSGGGQAGSIGLGFAIPVDYAMSVATALITGEQPQHGSLGINAQSVSDGTTDGVLVVRADAGSPAAEAGIQEKDVIIEADGKRVGSVEDINAITYTHKPGDKITLTVVSGGQEKTVEVTLGAA